MSGTSKFLARLAQEVRGLIGSHEGRTDNPHNTTKTQVGLSNVQNLPLADDAAVLAGLNASYLTPSSGRKLVNNEYRRLVKEEITIATNATKAYNIATLLAPNAALYDIPYAVVQVRVKDPDNTSPTFDHFIGAEAIALVGIKTTGEVLIKNLYETTLTFQVTIVVPRK